MISRGAQGHGPVHLLPISAAELGFAWDGAEKGCFRDSPPPLRMMTGPVQHFRSAILDAWRFSVFSRRKGFLGGEFADFQGFYNYLPRPICGNDIKCCYEPFCVEEFGPSWQGQEGKLSLSILW